MMAGISDHANDLSGLGRPKVRYYDCLTDRVLIWPQKTRQSLIHNDHIRRALTIMRIEGASANHRYGHGVKPLWRTHAKFRRQIGRRFTYARRCERPAGVSS